MDEITLNSFFLVEMFLPHSFYKRVTYVALTTPDVRLLETMLAPS